MDLGMTLLMRRGGEFGSSGGLEGSDGLGGQFFEGDRERDRPQESGDRDDDPGSDIALGAGAIPKECGHVDAEKKRRTTEVDCHLLDSELTNQNTREQCTAIGLLVRIGLLTADRDRNRLSNRPMVVGNRGVGQRKSIGIFVRIFFEKPVKTPYFSR
jgi:hypothetical protein